ncbi:MAG: hypothetical protein ACI8SR_000700 [Oceanicoccus sp.]|jgi:hypothetical protein
MYPQISFAHINKTPNVGDLMCAPYHYFYFPNASVYDLKSSIPPSLAVIYGGGAIEPVLRNDRIHDKVDARYKIAWGIGTSRSGMKDAGALIDDLDLCGRREFGRDGGEYVPCVSCMSDLFDNEYAVKHEIAFYTHAVKSKFENKDLKGMPVSPNRGDFSEIISFLASAETIVTDSFHGVYWATLLGKKVICIPFSSKFYGYKFPPTYAKYSTWRSFLDTATQYDFALQDCRDINRNFYEKVMNLIS